MRAKGVEITMEPGRRWWGIMAFIKDPNGVNIALIEHRQALNIQRIPTKALYGIFGKMADRSRQKS